tara:strand:+ start:4990 stop:5682 length:693 start_codon:yes stop_codon:yes gene_type:complete
MIKFFKKNNEHRLTDRDFEFLSALDAKIPTHDFSNQINKDFIIGKRAAMRTEREGSFSYQFNANLENKYFQSGPERFFEIKNIRANDCQGQSIYIELYIMKGVILGYYSETPIRNIDLESIDLTESFENHDDEKDEMTELLEVLGDSGDWVLKKLDTTSTFLIEFDNRSYYMIKDFGDGNYLGVTQNGKVYGLIHDPFTIEELFQNIDQFYKELRSGSFSPERYLDKKLQ